VVLEFDPAISFHPLLARQTLVFRWVNCDISTGCPFEQNQRS
jgi:hypothetical protein